MDQARISVAGKTSDWGIAIGNTYRTLGKSSTAPCVSNSHGNSKLEQNTCTYISACGQTYRWALTAERSLTQTWQLLMALFHSWLLAKGEIPFTKMYSVVPCKSWAQVLSLPGWWLLGIAVTWATALSSYWCSYQPGTRSVTGLTQSVRCPLDL